MTLKIQNIKNYKNLCKNKEIFNKKNKLVSKMTYKIILIKFKKNKLIKIIKNFK